MISKKFLNYHKLITPKFASTNIRFDLDITISLIDNILTYCQTNNKEYYYMALELEGILDNFKKNELENICNDILNSVLQNNKELLKAKENYLINKYHY